MTRPFELPDRRDTRRFVVDAEVVHARKSLALGLDAPAPAEASDEPLAGPEPRVAGEEPEQREIA